MKKLFIYVLQMTVAVGLLFIVSLSIPVSATGLTIVPHASNNIRYVYTKSAHTDLIHDKCIFDSCYTRFIEMGLLLDRYTYGAASINYANNVYPGTSSHAVGGPNIPISQSVWNKQRARKRAKQLETIQQELFSSGRYDEAAEKAKLVRQLTAFRDTATALPYLYATIDREYGGSIPAYVDALFENSAITNPKRMKRLVRKVTKRRLKNDMGFQFVVSKYVYRLWLEQGRPKAAQGDGIYVFPVHKE